jgi:DNA helicase-2/ATP-dependent DNA helicase PcrA
MTSYGRKPSWETRVNPYARKPQTRTDSARSDTSHRDATPAYRYEDEDQSGSDSVRPGTRVRHAQFGVGTVLNVEGSGAEMKLTVRFATVGQKKLVAKYANLQPA